MKAVFLRPRFALTALALLASAALVPQRANAQATGKTGTTIVFDSNTSHGLFASGATNSDKTAQWFSFLRHDIAHIQLLSSNSSALSSNGSGSFAENNNSMLFSNGKLKVSNWAGHFSGTYLAVVAPKGYRFTKYEWVIDASTADPTAGIISQYTYNGSSMTTVNKYSYSTTGKEATWSETLANGTNVLYFYVNTGQTGTGNSIAQQDFYFKKLKLTYVIDQPFEGSLPAADLTNNLSTGLLDLGTFSKNKAGNNSFDKNRPATDTQAASFYDANGNAVSFGTAQVAGDQYYVAATNGIYYVAAPEKFRIVGAKLNFLYPSDASQSKTTISDATSITSGKTYVISNGNGVYLNNNNGSISAGTDFATATRWTITGSSSYTIKSGSYYLYRNSNSLSLTNTSGSATSWSWNSNNGFYTSSKGSYYLQYKREGDGDSNGWMVNSSSLANANKLQLVETETVTAGSFTADVYGTDGSQVKETKSLTTAGKTETVTLTGLNNDAVKFEIKDLSSASALYNVTLTLLPLNPELQNLSVATQLQDGEVTGASAFTPENYIFNGGDGVTVVVPSTEKDQQHNLVFKDAYNENRTEWYTKGTNTSAGTADYSNYFLVNSTADNGGTTSVALKVNSATYPSDRTTATQAGIKKLVATNIEQVYSGTATTLQDNAFSKTNASYQSATVTPDVTSASTYYIYTADVPTYTLLTNGAQHIDYRYYTLVVSCKSVSEEPTATVMPIYTSTLKGRNHKNTGILADGDKADETTKFYGVKVTIQNQQFGYLTSKQVVDAVKAAVKTTYGDECDSLRGMLYLDMSSLKSVDYDAFDADFHNSTADNCLYFMYPGFHRNNIINTIAKKADNSYEAVSNITLYDQQPFFTPIAFKTGAYTVTYEREGTSDKSGAVKAKVHNMAVVLPFSVSLDSDGHLKTASDQTDQTITYHNITASGDATSHSYGDATHDLTYAVVASAVTDGKAEANKPYYVTKADDAEAGFTYIIAAAEFAQSGTFNDEETTVTLDNLTNEPTDAWKAIGSYSGAQPKKAENLWYFAKDYFWKSSQLKNNDHVNIRPFRAYFETTAKTNANSAKVVFDESEIQPTGINDVTADGTLQVAAGRGTLQITASADTHYTVVTVAGQLVANGLLTAGETRTISVPQGVYIVNNKKIIIK